MGGDVCIGGETEYKIHRTSLQGSQKIFRAPEHVYSGAGHCLTFWAERMQKATTGGAVPSMRHANCTARQGKRVPSMGYERQAGGGRVDLPKTSNHSVPVRTAGEKSITRARNCNNNWHLYSIRYPGVPKHLTDITSWTDLQAGDLAPCKTSIPTPKRRTPVDCVATFTYHFISGVNIWMLRPSTPCTI